MTTCAFATTCWDRDWKDILLAPNYLSDLQIGNHLFDFQDRFLVINNVKDLSLVKKAADRWVSNGVLTRYVVVDDIVEEMLSFFSLKRSDFRLGSNASEYGCVNPDWVYYNALGPLSAIFCADTDYLLYQTGDVFLDKKVSWIKKAIRLMEKNRNIKVANLVWNNCYQEAKKESYRKSWNFYYADSGFSDQQFLVKLEDFRTPMYGEIREDSSHFPRGDVFEKRVFSFMKNRGWERIVFRRGSYTHQNVDG
jgi:hypothetical protein